jgi:two-component system, NtrC family, response regulator GlrR
MRDEDTGERFEGEFTTNPMQNHKKRGGVVAALRNTSTSEVYPLDDGGRRWVLGSDRRNDVHVPDPFVSKVHCVIERRGDASLMVRDTGSRNGTFIDGNPVEAAELRVGAFMSVGHTTLLAMSKGNTGERPRAIEMIKGKHPSIVTSVEQAIRAAHTDCSVLVLGETGTGKELMARLVHESSRRSDGPFVAVNCGAIARDLIASELFGHERGSFTGASDTRDGFFVEASGGTLFLDELGELPLELQPHLLRVLETRRVRRVGGQSERAVDVRIVAATNQLDLIGSDGAGSGSSRLRRDLYHRLATMVLLLPPLRERMSDLVELVEAMLAEHAPELGTRRVSPEGWNALGAYTWPGNIRELRQSVVRAMTLGGEELGPSDFFPEFHIATAMVAMSSDTTLEQLVPYQAMMRGAMEQALVQFGSIRMAAQHLGMPKSTFADRAKQWGLTVKQKPRSLIARKAKK